MHDREIVNQLNSAGVLTGAEKPWTLGPVRWLRYHFNIPRTAPDIPRCVPLPERHPDSRYSISGAARLFGVSCNRSSQLDQARRRARHDRAVRAFQGRLLARRRREHHLARALSEPAADVPRRGAPWRDRRYHCALTMNPGARSVKGDGRIRPIGTWSERGNHLDLVRAAPQRAAALGMGIDVAGIRSCRQTSRYQAHVGIGHPADDVARRGNAQTREEVRRKSPAKVSIRTLAKYAYKTCPLSS